MEARALGRRAAGADISSLAVFLTDTKTSVFSPAELRRIQSWAREIHSQNQLAVQRPGAAIGRMLGTIAIR